ncbi:CPBP family intramembrane glutamic endopeptidase [Geodermatophilus sp. SYSU D01106]
MTARTSAPVPAGPAAGPAAGPVRRWVARRPLTAFTAVVFGAGWPVMSVPALTAHGLLPGGALPVEPFVLATLLLVMLPAAVGVTAVLDGRAGVRALLARTVRWRFGAGWWAAVGLGLPAVTLAAGLVTGRVLVLDDAGAVLAGAVLSAVGALLLVNLWEETVWAGFLQTRLQQRSGPWRAALLTGVAFAGIHVPLQFTDGVTAGSALAGVGVLLGAGVLVRALAGAVLTGTGGSVLAVAVLHASSNASNSEDELVDRLLSGGSPLVLALAATAVLTASLVAVQRRR